MLSSIDIYNHGSDYGDIKLSCTVFLTKGIHDPGNEVFLHQVCALLNSGGGIISMQNADVNKNVLPKHLDLWWSGMESCIARILSVDDIVNFVDFVGNFDDQYFYLFVKSAELFCTVDYCCRLPTDTATHEVSYKSAVRLCQRETNCSSLDLLPPIPTRFEYGRTEETLKQEGKQIQFKLVTSRRETSGKSLALKVSHYSIRYVSAFANHEGGHIYFGIEDTTAGVYGEVMGSEEEGDIVYNLERRLKSMIWSDTKFVPERGVHWDIRFLPVFKNSGYMADTRVIVVSVCKVNGGVFTSCPESYMIARLQGGNQQPYLVQRPKFDDWKRLLLNQTRDCPSLHTRFIKLYLMTPQCRLTFSLPQTLQSAREKVIKFTTGFNFHPKNFLHCLTRSDLKHAINQLLGVFADEDHLAFTLDSWGLSLQCPATRPDGVLICMAIFSAISGIHVISLVEGGGGGGEAGSNLRLYISEVAVSLKQCLVNHGGCYNHLGIKIHLVDITSPNMIETFQHTIQDNIYPQTYQINKQKMEDVLRSLTIAIASYKPFGNNIDKGDMDHYFLLTSDQLELLWTHQCTKELWVHGPPGAGKTVAALEMVKEFRRRGNTKDQVLYVAENNLICSYVRSFNICLVVNRRDLMTDASNPDLFNSKYGCVKNVIVDEAQNFKSRDGDWYRLLEKLSKQNVIEGQFDLTAGYFWLFMDYAQKVHKFEAGLPGLIGKNNFMLSEISRNSKEIFEYASKFIDKRSSLSAGNCVNEISSHDKAMQVAPVLGHQFSSGQGVSVVKCDKSSMHDVLFQVLKKFSQDGVDFEDMAILVSKKKDSEALKNSIKKNNLFGNVRNDVPDSVASDRDMASTLSAGFNSSLRNDKVVSVSNSPAPCSSNLITSGINVDATGKDFSALETGIVSQNVQEVQNDEMSVVSERPISTTLHGTISSGVDTPSKSDPLLVSTVREFSGLDKPVIVGMEPHTNPDHADLEKMILNMATRARDSLVILTTSNELMDMLKPSNL